MTTFLSVLLVLACFILVGAVLLQPAKAGASALGGTSSSIFGSTGGTTFLFRLTMWTAAFIMVTCLYVSWEKVNSGRKSFVDSAVLPTDSEPVSTEAPAAAPISTPAGEPTPEAPKN